MKDTEEYFEGSSNLNENLDVISQSDNSSTKSQPALAAVDYNHQTDSPKEELCRDEVSDSSEEECPLEKNDFLFDDDIVLMTYKRNGLINLKEQLVKDMQAERDEIEQLKYKLKTVTAQMQ